ncbi:DUF4255 domain-containing protein [Umezawaea beigongshangensis]|uniref:DUF4255 domain-containing protein n=1 Tax=Umezawaea beigongshangensis TaxID=2780383 RepID=UPI0018F224C7|nr:DUF4255 domain-containing protein [Umezawaea beigongshangensis]
MSNFLAVATVTEALRAVVGRAVADVQLGTNVVTGKPPSDPPQQDPTVTIFLYQVVPNAALRNRDAVTRGPDGTVLKTPQLALDLHYLISFYGNETELVPQRLLGATTRTLHEEPTLSRADVEAAAARQHLLGSDLAASPQAVRFTPLSLDLDDLSKLWSTMVQTPYALSVVYQATAVLLDGKSVPATGTPVLRRRIAVEASTRPVVESVLSLAADAEPGTAPDDGPITSDRRLAVLGSDLGRRGLSAVVGGVPADVLRARDDLVVLAQPPGLPPGTHPVQLRYDVRFGDPAADRPWLESNTAPYVRRPGVVAATRTGSDVLVRLDVPAGVDQRVELLLDERAPAGTPRGFRFTAPFPLAAGPEPVEEFTVPTAGVLAGTYLVRVRVDGAESPLHVEDGAFSGPAIDFD